MKNNEAISQRRKCFKFTVYLFSYLLALFWGTAIVKWQIPPYNVYVWAKKILGLPRYAGPFPEVSDKFAFINPIIEVKDQIEPAVENFEQLDERVRKIELAVQRFPKAYETLRILNTSFSKPNVFRLDFEHGSNYTAYCYFAKSLAESNRTALLLIPGSGFNQSSEPFAKLTGSELKNLVRGRSEVFLRQDPNFSLDIADFGHDYPGKPGVSVFL